MKTISRRISLSKQARTQGRINEKLNKHLIAYATAAGAAGVGALALTPSAEAKVVYTATNTEIPRNSQLLLDLNHDGVNDFSFYQFSYGGWDHFYFSPLVKGDGVLENKNPADLRAGVPIGPKGQFGSSKIQMLAKCGGTSGFSQTSGNWNEVTNRYLGLKFVVNGETHYGWARLTVTGKGGLGATLTGYAYETIPNKRILAGQTTESEDVSADSLFTPIPREQATLVMLASGADGLAIWRAMRR
jgi:hypothetical protein